MTDGWMDGRMMGASLAWLSVTHPQFIHFHSSLWLSHVTPIQPAPNDLSPHRLLQPTRETIPIPVPYSPCIARSLTHSFTSHSHLTLSSPSLHTPLRTPPNPLAPIPPLQQLDSSPSPPRHSLLQPFSRYFTSPPPQIICTHPPAVHRYRKSIPRLLPPLLLYSNRSNYLSFSQCGHQL